MRVTQAFALLVALLCLLLLLRLGLNPVRRHRVDGWGRRAWARVRAGAASVWRARMGWRRVRHPFARRADKAAAKALAADAIARARGASSREVDKEGNVLRPRAFGRDKGTGKPPQKPH